MSRNDLCQVWGRECQSGIYIVPRVLFRASRYNSIVVGYLVFRSAQLHNDSGKEVGGGGGFVPCSISSFPVS